MWEVHFVPELLPFVFDYKLGLTNAPLVERSVVLVVSLVVDQVRTLSSRGVCCHSLWHGNRGIDRNLVANEKDVSAGKYRLLYTAPEAVLEDHTWSMLLLAHPLSSTLMAIAIDEAHCVYKW